MAVRPHTKASYRWAIHLVKHGKVVFCDVAQRQVEQTIVPLMPTQQHISGEGPPQVGQRGFGNGPPQRRLECVQDLGALNSVAVEELQQLADRLGRPGAKPLVEHPPEHAGEELCVGVEAAHLAERVEHPRVGQRAHIRPPVLHIPTQHPARALHSRLHPRLVDRDLRHGQAVDGPHRQEWCDAVALGVRSVHAASGGFCEGAGEGVVGAAYR